MINPTAENESRPASEFPSRLLFLAFLTVSSKHDRRMWTMRSCYVQKNVKLERVESVSTTEREFLRIKF